MSDSINRLSDRRVQTLKEPGRHADGGGLYLVVDKSSAKRWVFMSWKNKRQVEIGLGGLSSVPLAMARRRAAECRRLIAEGRDPRNAVRERRCVPTFAEFAEVVIASLEKGWRNEKHRQQWRNTLATYAASLSSKPVSTITTEDVLGILRPIWIQKAETASRVRGRIEKILDAAKANGHRSDENPARWRGHLDHLLPKRQKLQRGHHPAMAWQDLPVFVAHLQERPSIAALACEFMILTAARSGEILGSRLDGKIHAMSWAEVDFDARIWTVPATRMKGGLEHRVPLSNRAVEILKEVKRVGNGTFVFPGQRPNRPLSNGAILALLKRMVVEGVTPHGFRSTFRDWVGENTNFPREVAEAALAHTIGNKVERAYRRDDALGKRRKLMDAWAAFCASERLGNVVSLRRRATAMS
jgi:integrase